MTLHYLLHAACLALLSSFLLAYLQAGLFSFSYVIQHGRLPGQFFLRIIIGSDRRPETKQGIEGKIDRFRSGRVRVLGSDRRSEPNRRSEPINFGAC